MSNDSPVTILLRVKPSIENEKNKKEIIKIDEKRIVLSVPKTKVKVDKEKSFSFKSVYDGNVKTQTIYDDYCFAILDDVFKGYNGTIMSYGSTGSGKTFTMSGDPDNGIVQNIFQDLMKLKASTKESYLIYLSFFEIYQEKIMDLHGKDRTQSLKIKNIHKNPQVDGLVMKKCESVEDCLDFYKKGNKSRRIGETASNLKSSRSHAILQIRVRTYQGDENNKIREGTLYLVDLAGSERLKKSKAEGLRKEETAKINSSMLALGNVILALATNKPHIPYRDSNLTTVLKNSLGGNSKTVFIANIHSTEDFYEEILNTLNYANRAQYIRNRATINEDPKDKIISELKNEIQILRKEIEELKNFKVDKREVIENDQDNETDSDENYEEEKNLSVEERRKRHRERKIKAKLMLLKQNEDNLNDIETIVKNRFSFNEVDEALKREIESKRKKVKDKLMDLFRNDKEYTDDEKKILQLNFEDLKNIDSSMIRKMLEFIKKQERVIEIQKHELDDCFALSDQMKDQIADLVYDTQPETDEEQGITSVENVEPHILVNDPKPTDEKKQTVMIRNQVFVLCYSFENDG